MTEESKRKLTEFGVDVDGTLERMLGNEALFERVLKKFISDDSYPLLVETLASGDYESAFRHAHTLKGVTGNLGIDALMEAAIVVVEKLRVHNLEGIEEDMKKVSELYEEICEVLKNL